MHEIARRRREAQLWLRAFLFTDRIGGQIAPAKPAEPIAEPTVAPTLHDVGDQRPQNRREFEAVPTAPPRGHEQPIDAGMATDDEVTIEGIAIQAAPGIDRRSFGQIG